AVSRLPGRPLARLVGRRLLPRFGGQPGAGHLALPDGARGSDETQPAIEFSNVSRWYGDTVALADVSFTIGSGVTGLLGHNGAGKSTALRLMGGFADTSSGSVSVLGL